MSNEAHQSGVGMKPPKGAEPSPDASLGATDLISTLEAQLSSLKTAKAAAAKAEADLLQRQTDLAKREGELKSLRQDLESRAESARASEKSLSELKAQLEAQRGDLESLDQKLREQREALERRFAEATERLSQLEQREKGVVEREQSAEERGAKADALRQQLEEAARAFEQRRGEHEEQIRAKQAELEDAGKSLQSAIQAAKERASELAEQKEAFEIERRASSGKSSERDKALAAARAEVEKLKAELKSSAAGASEAESARAAELEKQIAERDKKIDQLEVERERTDSELNAAGNRLAELEKLASEAGAKIAEAERRAEDAVRRAEAASTGDESEALAGLREQIEKRDLAIEKLREKLAETQRRVEEAESRAQAGGGSGEPAAAGLLEASANLRLRKDRLHRYKTLLRDQSSKILQAKSALAKRHEQYEQVLQKRAELATVKATLDRRAARLDKAAGRNRVSVALFCVAATIGILAVLSWSLAQKLVPAQYLVQATVTAGGDGRTLAPEELEAWQTSMRQLASDPRLVDTVAERMKRRGMLHLSTPGDVKHHLDRDLDIAPTKPGELIFSLRGAGEEQTRRVLDTYLAAFIAIANEGRTLRADNASASVSGKPTPDPEPLDQPHLVYAAALWAGSSGLFLVGGLVAWTRLSRASKQFDTPDESAATLAQGGWAVSDQS